MWVMNIYELELNYYLSINFIIHSFSRIFRFYHIQACLASGNLGSPSARPPLLQGWKLVARYVCLRPHDLPSVYVAYLSSRVIRVSRPPPFALTSSRWPQVLGWGGSRFLMQVLLRRWPNPRRVRRSSRSSAIDEIFLRCEEFLLRVWRKLEDSSSSKIPLVHPLSSKTFLLPLLLVLSATALLSS